MGGANQLCRTPTRWRLVTFPKVVLRKALRVPDDDDTEMNDLVYGIIGGPQKGVYTLQSVLLDDPRILPYRNLLRTMCEPSQKVLTRDEDN